MCKMAGIGLALPSHSQVGPTRAEPKATAGKEERPDVLVQEGNLSLDGGAGFEGVSALTPAAVGPEREQACLWKKSRAEELRRNDGDRKLVVWRVPLHAAALAVQELAPDMGYQEAWAFIMRGWRGNRWRARPRCFAASAWFYRA